MDKLEDKLYQSMETAIDCTDVRDPNSWARLLKMQERLQQCMIESHKLLQPYLDIEDLSIADLIPTTEDLSTNNTLYMTAESRESLRNNAQALLTSLSEVNK